jgi:hypothetical protein
MTPLESKFLSIINSDCHHDSYCDRQECNVLGFTFCHTNMAQIKKTSEIATEVAVRFYTWMKAQDTEENAEKYFGFSDEDMFCEFINNHYSK